MLRWFAAALLTAALVLIFFPIWAPRPHGKGGLLLGANLQPVVGKNIVIEGDDGSRAVLTDSQGRFDIFARRHESVKDFVLAYRRHSTGGTDTLAYCQAGSLELRFIDASNGNGAQVPVSVSILPADSGGRWSAEGHAVIRIEGVPVALPPRDIQICLSSPKWRVVRWNRWATYDGVYYEVMLQQLKEPLGLPRWQSLSGQKAVFGT